MISKSHIASASAASGYLTNEPNGTQPKNAQGEYYTKDQVRSAWGGEGAALAGQSVGGQVSRQDLENILSGRVREPVTGEVRQLGRVTTDKETGKQTVDHRAGMDFTFSAPKSVSIASEVFGKEEVRQAHEKAVDAAMGYLEKHAAQARVQGEKITTGNFVYAKFEHSLTRELDPSTHTHVAIANVTYSGGKAYSLSNEQLLIERMTADQVYKNELAHELQKTGYTVEIDQNGVPEIAGINQAQKDEFSARSQQIDAYLQAHGINPETASSGQRQAACLETRAGKSAPENAEQQRGQWQTRAEATGLKEPQPDPSLMRDRDPLAGREAVACAIKHLGERESAWSKKDLYAAAAKFSEGRASYSQIETAIQQAQKTGVLVPHHADPDKFTSSSAIQSEMEMAQRLEAGRGAHQQVMTAKEFDKAVVKFEVAKGFKLTNEQRAAASMILTGNDRHAGVQGLAGTGKTTMLELVREAAESKGWQVEGFSNGAAQAQKMGDESGIATTTTASFLLAQDKAANDRALAQAALKTHESGIKADYRALREAVKNGTADRAFDSKGREFIKDAKGNIHAAALAAAGTAKGTQSRNLNHLGLTKTDYVIVKDKGLSGLLGGTTVIKTSGTLKSELAGHLKDNHFKGDGLIDKFARSQLSKAEGWKKAGVLESAMVRMKVTSENRNAHKTALAELKQQAGSAQPEPQKTLRIMDEASMAGQREFNRVAAAADASGAKQVFLGDKMQHQSVEAGKAFEKAQAHMPMSTLEQISRQKTEHAKATVRHIIEGRHGEAVRGLPTKEVRNEQASVLAKWAGKLEKIEARQAAGEKLSERDKATRLEFKNELRQAAQKDNLSVIKALAKDYASMTKAERDSTLIVTGTNADRTAINNAVRENLKARGEIRGGQNVETLQRKDMTDAEKGRAASYQVGNVVKLQNDYAGKGQRGDTATVEKVNSRDNTITAKTQDGRAVVIQPDKHKVDNYTAKDKEFGVGDKVQFKENSRDLGVKNNQTGMVEKIDGNKMTVKMDGSGERKEIDTSKYKQIDHGYTSTSHGSQGQTVDKTMVHHNTGAGKHGDRETYVNDTRAKNDTTIYTQDREKAAQQSGQKLDKSSATPSQQRQHAEKPEPSKQSPTQAPAKATPINAPVKSAQQPQKDAPGTEQVKPSTAEKAKFEPAKTTAPTGMKLDKQTATPTNSPAKSAQQLQNTAAAKPSPAKPLPKEQPKLPPKEQPKLPPKDKSRDNSFGR